MLFRECMSQQKELLKHSTERIVPEGSGNVFALVKLNNIPDVRHISFVDSFQKWHQV